MGKKKIPSLIELKKQVAHNYKSSKVERFLYEFTSKCFNTELSSTCGFGARDLKEPYFNLYTDLLKKYKQNLVVKFIDLESMTIQLWVKE